MRIAIANHYGNVDLTKTRLTGRYRHIPGKRLQPLCRKLQIRYAEAVTGWSGNKRYGYKPVTDGVVVSAVSAPRLLAEVEARRLRNPPERLEAANRRRHERRFATLHDAGIHDPDSRTARWYEHGEIDSYEAQLIQFKADYRHEFTDYDTHLKQLREEAYRQSGQERRMLLEEVKNTARAIYDEKPIPGDWNEYLDTYGFPYPEVASRLAEVLKSPQQAHPTWFCEAVLAVKWCEQDLDTLTYESIRDAIQAWRCARSED
jgi:hypothetical protein